MAAAAGKASHRQAAAPRAAQTPLQAENLRALAPANFQPRQPAAVRQPVLAVAKEPAGRPTQVAAIHWRAEHRAAPMPAACKAVIKVAQARSRAALPAAV